MFLGFKHSRTSNTIPGTKRKRIHAETGTMQVHGARYARISIPRIPLRTIFRFAIIGFGGALFLFYSFFGTGDAIQFAHPKSDAPVYAMRAVPRDSQSAAPAGQRSGQRRRLTASDEGGTEKVASTRSSALSSSSAKDQLTGVDAFPEFESHNSYPDPSTWVFGVALVALVGVRCVHARWRRSQRLAEQKEARSHAPARGCTR
jgi:hypothetical protein